MTTIPSVQWTAIVVSPDKNLQQDVGIQTATTPIARSSHGVSYVNHSDTLVVYGGEHFARTPLPLDQSCWACSNISTKEPYWKNITYNSLSQQPAARIAHAQTIVEDRYIYIFGGRAGITMHEQPMNDLWVLDTNTWNWKEIDTNEATTGTSAATTKPCQRSYHRMIAIDTDLYVFGGCGAAGRLNDLWKFDTVLNTWYNLGCSLHLLGRGGPNLLPIADKTKLAIIAGFAGEETNDGHCYHLLTKEWDKEPLQGLQEMRPRSVCCAAVLKDAIVIFGGEVDPSAKGHEGAGGFENDVVVLDSSTATYLNVVKASNESNCPAPRGWSACCEKPGTSTMWIFGGLSGDDSNPVRLGDLWRLDLLTGS